MDDRDADYDFAIRFLDAWDNRNVLPEPPPGELWEYPGETHPWSKKLAYHEWIAWRAQRVVDRAARRDANRAAWAGEVRRRNSRSAADAKARRDAAPLTPPERQFMNDWIDDPST